MTTIVSCIETVIKIINGFNEGHTFSQWVGPLVSSLNGTEKQELKEDDLQKLQSPIQCLRDTLRAMCTIIDRVEWRSHENSVAELLPRLKAAVYDAEDLLEVFRWYEQKVNIEHSATPAESATKFFKDFNQGNFKNELTNIKETLDNQFRLLEAMGLHQATPRFDKLVRPETTRVSIEPKIFGRDDELKKLITLLGVPANNRRGHSRPKRKRSVDRSSASNQVCATLDNSEATLTSVPVLPIVGIGGVGKTTLAQAICSHPQVKSHFDKIVWICVSDDFDDKRLTKEAIEEFSGKAPSNGSLDTLKADLKASLKKGRFLIVLDDMWAEDKELWKTFCAPFNQVLQEDSSGKKALQGSMMVVTTRSQKVAGIVRTMDPFALEGLKEDDFQKFFNQCVFGSDSSNNYHELKLIGEKMLPKLKGSPLAAKTLGRLLGRRLEPTHWNNILNSQLWEHKQEGTEILPALRLSYIYLPFHLRKCFSFCAVYPKDYNFVKEDLTEIWLAEGFVEPKHNIPLQQTACEYFEELEYLSFFQKLGREYVMHDLIHDMAQLVSKDECFIVKDKKDLEKIPKDVRHLSVLKSGDFQTSDLENLFKQTKLRTLFCDESLSSKAGKAVMQKWCTKLLCMRVMVCGSVSSLPDSICNMKNLRYLQILGSCKYFNLLPTTVCCLYNLQLICARNYIFNQLPRGFTNLVNLIKFESKGLKIDAAVENREGIRLLKKSNLITRELVISNLCEISKDEAAEIELAKKEYISSLTLKWSKGTPHLPGSPEHNPEHNEIEVFKALHPPTSIKSVHLKDYPGDDLPSWCHGSDDRTILSSLTEIKVTDCPRLSSLGKFLKPADMPAIKKIAISNCTNLESVPVETFQGFPSLEELDVSNCPKINSQPLLAPSLKKLYLRNCGNLGDDIDCRSLQELFLLDCGYFSVSCLENLTSLKILQMYTCKHIENIPRDLWSTNLKALYQLVISNCEGLVSIGGPEAIAHIPIVHIEKCQELKEIQQPLRR